MKISRETAARHRESILTAASRLFRRRGPDVSVAEVTREAGLTHGAFYNHFASKEALLGEASAAAHEEQAAVIRRALGREGIFDGWVEGYLSGQHLGHPEGGCAVAALAGDIARQDSAVQTRFAEGLGSYLEALEELWRTRRPQASGEEARAAAIRIASTLAGAMAMARAVASADDRLAAEILSTVSAGVRREPANVAVQSDG